MAIVLTHQEAAYAVADLNRAGFSLRKILIVASDFPSDDITNKIKNWRELRPAWATLGCLNAIGAGLDFLGMNEDDIRRCGAVLDENRIIVVLKGTRNEVVRARLVCSEKGTLARRIRT